ncbi:hypothetical protein EST38_g4816 [Candolleomyces aberdarensis]|uniref:Uncharacterized protein n=1 Tax=Candolleomyces aberdarensis TaxID=2316362 RepID=A0A4V1Q469_9AGAR|nr:hypothetical protein EST38_g4816 [Candolleomyces aberdarensis]
MGSSDYSGGESDSGGSSYSYGGKKEKKDKKDKKEKKDKDKKDKGKEKDKDKDGKDKDKKDKKEKDHKDKDGKDKKEHKDKDKKDKDKDKDKKDKKDKDKHKDDKPSTSYVLPAAPSFPAVAGSSGHGAPSIPNFPSPQGYHHNAVLGVSHPSPLPPPSGPAPTIAPKTMSFDGPPSSGYRVPLDSNDPSKPFPSHNLQESGPPVTYDLDGSPIFIGSVLLENAVHPCKIGPHLQPPAQVAYGGGEIGHLGRYDLLPFVPDQMEWVRTGYGQIPHGKRPVEGGYEEGGAKLYHALAVINDVKVPGKTGEHLGGANVGFGGVEHAVQEGYEILCWKY